MSLTRSRLGLQNERLFYSVDLVVYTEGGESLSLSKVTQGEYNDSAADLRFWDALFDALVPSLKRKIKPVGSKTVLEKLAEKMESAEVPSPILAFDRDADTSTVLNHPLVVYTYGYSWENDVWQRDVLLDVIQTMAPLAKNRSERDAKIQKCWKEFVGAIDPVGRLEKHAFLEQTELKRARAADRFLKCKPRSMPCIDHAQVRECLAKHRKAVSKAAAKKAEADDDFVANRDICGHLWCSFCCRVVSQAVSMSERGNLPKYAVTGCAVEVLFRQLRLGRHRRLWSHYERQLRRALGDTVEQQPSRK